MKLRLGVLGSGKGSNFAAILEAIRNGVLNAEVAIVLSDVESAGILALARSAGVPAAFVREDKYRTRLSEEVEREIVKRLKTAGANLVVLAGFMRVLKGPILDSFPRRVINIHPSLLPRFRGLCAWKQALEAGANRTGCTVHYVDSGVDSGDIIAQAEVPVLEGDTPESLHARIQIEEHRLYPQVIATFAAQPVAN